MLDTASLHQIKKNTPGYTNLDQYYKEVYEYPSDKYLLAQRNFVESTAGYSILTYLLQVSEGCRGREGWWGGGVKERNNGIVLSSPSLLSFF